MVRHWSDRDISVLRGCGAPPQTCTNAQYVDMARSLALQTVCKFVHLVRSQKPLQPQVLEVPLRELFGHLRWVLQHVFGTVETL